MYPCWRHGSRTPWRASASSSSRPRGRRTARQSSSRRSSSRTGSWQRRTPTRGRRSGSRSSRARSASGWARRRSSPAQGETVTIPARTPYRFWNASGDEWLARSRCEVRPALQFEQLLEKGQNMSKQKSTGTRGGVLGHPQPRASRNRPNGVRGRKGVKRGEDQQDSEDVSEGAGRRRHRRGMRAAHAPCARAVGASRQ